MNPQTSTITLTFGDQAENHVGMEQLGQKVAEGEGFHYEDLVEIYHRFMEQGVTAELYSLHESAAPEAASNPLPPAYVLVLRNAAQAFGLDAATLWEEQVALPVDKKAFMYGRVVNKHARWNLCFDDVPHEPDYENGKGRVIGYEQVPHLDHMVRQFPEKFGPKGENLKGEGNYYYDVSSCGIGFHGDSERRKVVALRLGASLPLYYQWYHSGKPVGPRIELELHNGDMYVMSEKAVGTDWKKKTVYTLRHATGSASFTKV